MKTTNFDFIKLKLSVHLWKINFRRQVRVAGTKAFETINIHWCLLARYYILRTIDKLRSPKRIIQTEYAPTDVNTTFNLLTWVFLCRRFIRCWWRQRSCTTKIFVTAPIPIKNPSRKSDNIASESSILIQLGNARNYALVRLQKIWAGTYQK